MAKYFNTLRTSLPLQFVGKSTSVPAKTYIEIVGEDEGTTSVQRAVAQGKLKKMLNMEELVSKPAALLVTRENKEAISEISAVFGQPKKEIEEIEVEKLAEKGENTASDPFKTKVGTNDKRSK